MTSKSINNIDDIIEQNNLTLNNSTLIKLACNVDQLIMNCFLKGSPHFNEIGKCKFCDEHRYKLNDPNVKCKKHYALDLYRDANTRISDIVLKGEKFEMFGRYALRRTENCDFVFYFTPLHVDPTRFRVFAYPSNVFEKREPVFSWDITGVPRQIGFTIQNNPYILDCTNVYNINYFLL